MICFTHHAADSLASIVSVLSCISNVVPDMGTVRVDGKSWLQ